MKSLFLIPARKGSKGIPKKNVKLLNGKPLIAYTIEYALQLAERENICISTDDPEVIEIAKSYNLSVPFVRPDHLAEDNATSYDVIRHAIDFYEDKGKVFDSIILLQPTSPFRKKEHLENAIKHFTNDVEAVFSVSITKSNPYHVLFEEDENGYLQKSKELGISRRQDAPVVYEANGSIYIIDVKAMKSNDSWSDFNRIVKVEMPSIYSVDIDNMEDWNYCEFILEKGLLDT